MSTLAEHSIALFPFDTSPEAGDRAATPEWSDEEWEKAWGEVRAAREQLLLAINQIAGRYPMTPLRGRPRQRPTAREVRDRRRTRWRATKTWLRLGK